MLVYANLSAACLIVISPFWLAVQIWKNRVGDVLMTNMQIIEPLKRLTDNIQKLLYNK